MLTGRLQNDTQSSQNTSRPFESPFYLTDIKANIVINEPSRFIFPKTQLIKTSPYLAVTNYVGGLDTLKKAKGVDVKLSYNEYANVSFKRVPFKE